MALQNKSSIKIAHTFICINFHINIAHIKNSEKSPFLEERDSDILTVNETWFKSIFKLDIWNYVIPLSNIGQGDKKVAGQYLCAKL